MMRHGLCLLLLVQLVSHALGDTWELRDLYSFGQRDPQGGQAPTEPPVLGADGAIYGTTSKGGAFNLGVVYRFDPVTTDYVVLHHFLGGSEGGPPVGSAFLQAGDGRLYGFAVNPQLLLYSLAADGTDYRVVFSFPGGAQTNATSLTAGPDGLLYGIYMTRPNTTSAPLATIFRIGRDGSEFQILAPELLDASSPVSFGANGQLFGLTSSSVYRLGADGSGFQTIHQFPPKQSGTVETEGGLAHASDGYLYGTTNNGGSFRFGTIFRLRADGSEFQVIYEPTNVNDGGHDRASPFEGSDGYIYGAVGENSFGVSSNVWRVQKNGSGFQVLKRLTQGLGTNGIVEARDGFLYGHSTPTNNGGELFRLARDGSSYTIVHNFDATDGFPLLPVAIVRGADQKLYGLTDRNGAGGRGTLFRINADGSGYSIIHEFGAGSAEMQGSIPKAICAGPDGAIYGLVSRQGSGGAGVFRYRPADGAFTWLHTFSSSAPAAFGSLLAGSDGLLYGALDTGTTKTEQIFRLEGTGANFAVLRTITGTSSSVAGSAALAEGPDGLLYGAMTRNGASNVPLLFRMTRDGSVFVPLHDVNVGSNPALAPPNGILVATDRQIYGFAANAFFRCNGDGSGFEIVHTFPGLLYTQRPIEGFDGRIYGVVPFGGSGQRGAVFRVNRDGSGYEEIITYGNEPVYGRGPLGTLITAADGAFLGLTQLGGDANHGTLFRLTTPSQIVGIAGETLHFDALHHFTGSVVGPPGRAVDVQRSDDLQNWTLLQRVPAPELDATFTDLSMTRPRARFYRAVAP